MLFNKGEERHIIITILVIIIITVLNINNNYQATRKPNSSLCIQAHPSNTSIRFIYNILSQNLICKTWIHNFRGPTSTEIRGKDTHHLLFSMEC